MLRGEGGGVMLQRRKIGGGGGALQKKIFGSENCKLKVMSSER